MSCLQKSKQKYKHQENASTAVGKGKVAPEPLESDDFTRLSADGLQQFPTDLASPDMSDPDTLLYKFRSIVRGMKSP